MFKELKPKSNFILALTVTALVLILGVLFHQGYKEDYYNYFALAVLIAPVLIISLSNNKWNKDIAQVVFVIIIVILSAIAFWDYKEKPWFSPLDDGSCDGPCYGWFSFENELRILPLIVTGIASSIMGFIIKAVRMKLRKQAITSHNKVYEVQEKVDL